MKNGKYGPQDPDCREMLEYLVRKPSLSIYDLMEYIKIIASACNIDPVEVFKTLQTLRIPQKVKNLDNSL